MFINILTIYRNHTQLQLRRRTGGIGDSITIINALFKFEYPFLLYF